MKINKRWLVGFVLVLSSYAKATPIIEDGDEGVHLWGKVYGKETTQIEEKFLRTEETLPDTIGTLKNLEKIYIHVSKLKSFLPKSLSYLVQLKQIFIVFTNLEGEIPESLGKLRNLTVLLLYQNKLTGSIPSSLGNLRRLTKLDLSFNKLTGLIPCSLENLSQLKKLDLSNNQLTGPIPESFSNLKNLSCLSLWNNQLVGVISEGIGKLNQLKRLILSNNQLTGPIPESFENLKNLTFLNLRGNQLTGTIPESIGNLPYLKTAYLNKNNFTGVYSNLVKRIKVLQLNDIALQDYPEAIVHVLNDVATISVKRDICDPSIFYLFFNQQTSLALHENEEEKFERKIQFHMTSIEEGHPLKSLENWTVWFEGEKLVIRDVSNTHTFQEGNYPADKQTAIDFILGKGKNTKNARNAGIQ